MSYVSLGVGTSHASFDRFHLTNLAQYAFFCYSAIFRQSLFVNITDWESFAVFYLTNSLSYFIGFVLPMSETCFNLAHHVRNYSTTTTTADGNAVVATKLGESMGTTGEGVRVEAVGQPQDSGGGGCCCCRSCCALAAKIIQPDLLHHRGRLCYSAFLKNRATTIASLQYATFILFIGATGHNSSVFLNFSAGADFNLSQQLLFVGIAWSLDYLNFTLTNLLCKRAYDITPIYVGNACLKQYPRTRRALLFVAAHIISDVYLGMCFAMEGGIYDSDEVIATPAE